MVRKFRDVSEKACHAGVRGWAVWEQASPQCKQVWPLLAAGQEATRKELADFKIEVLVKLDGSVASQTISDSKCSSNGLSMAGPGDFNVRSFSNAVFCSLS